MKYIEKSEEPAEFSKWKSDYPTATYTDLGRDGLFPGAQRARWSLREALLNEQKGLCCYCESLIADGDFHIEHFRPKDPDQFPELQLAYENLHACCRRQRCGGDDEHCGHKKANSFSVNLVSPLDPGCSSHFEYDMTGAIIGSDNDGVETVSLLRLDSALLTSSRKRLIEYFEDLDNDEYEEEIRRHLDPNAYPLGEFFTTIEYLHNRCLLH